MIPVMILSFLTSSLYGSSYSGKGLISKLTVIPDGDNKDYILVNGFDSAGNCPNAQGLVVAKFQTTESGNRAYSLAVAAKLSGKQIRLVVNDTSKNQEGFCYVRAIELIELEWPKMLDYILVQLTPKAE